MKKAIILLVTLFFIMIISLSVIKNLDKSEALISAGNEQHNQTQLLLLIKSYQEEIAQLLAKNKNSLTDIIYDENNSQSIGIDMPNIKTSFELQLLEDLYNMNDIFSQDLVKQSALEQFLIQNGIDYDNFKGFTEKFLFNINAELQSFDSKQQVDDILDEYGKDFELFYEQELKKSLYFMDFSGNKKYVLCILNLELYNKSYVSHIIYDMQNIQDNKVGVIDFEIIFK